MLRVRALFSIAIAMTLVSCAVDPAGDPRATEAQRDDAESALETAATAQAATGTDDAALAAAGCAVVTTCNAAGPDGTRCRQQGCSLGAAELECELEAFSVCGAATCPVILIRTDGTRDNLCQSGRP
jgi:hypothetical protein